METTEHTVVNREETEGLTSRSQNLWVLRWCVRVLGQNWDRFYRNPQNTRKVTGQWITRTEEPQKTFGFCCKAPDFLRSTWSHLTLVIAHIEGCVYALQQHISTDLNVCVNTQA